MKNRKLFENGIDIKLKGDFRKITEHIEIKFTHKYYKVH